MSIYRNENGELLDLKVIDLIVSAIGILNIFPSEEETIKFLVPLINTVPGCNAVNFCFGSSSDPQGNLNDEKCSICNNKSAKELKCMLTEQDNIHSYPLETVVQFYGYLNVLVEDEREFVKYESFVLNLANAFVLILENNAQKKALQLQNELLERRVLERTSELQKKNLRFESVIESSSDMIVMMNTDYQYILFNTAFNNEHKKIFGKEVKQGDLLVQVFENAPEEYVKAKKNWDRVLAGEDYIGLNVFSKNAIEINWYESHYSPIKGLDGNIIGGVQIVRDITEMKRMETEHLSQFLHYKMLMQTSQDAIHIIDNNGKLIEWNDSFKNHLGYPEVKLPLLYVWDWSVTRNKQETLKLLSEITEEAVSIESLHQLNDGSIKSMDVRVHRFIDKDKEYYYASARDVTERKKSEELLRVSESKMRAILDNSFDAIGLHHNGIWEMCNPETLKLFGYTKIDELIGTPIINVIAKGEQERIKTYVQNRMNDKDAPKAYITRGVKKNGTEFDLEVSLTDFMQENKKHVLVILRDISERTNHEQEMKLLNNELRELATHQITAREEERSFIAKEIHDALAQNLVALNLNASYLKSKLEKDENKLILDEQIAISNELISSSRVLFNSLHPSMLDEIGLVAAIKWYVKARLKSGNVLFNIYSKIEDESLPINVRLDLFRIFQESFTNTLRYANAKKITVDIKSEGQHIVMLISDDGCGFDMNEVNTKIQHGLLGMRERVYTLRGSFTIQSKPGEGTRIEVAVPFGVK